TSAASSSPLPRSQPPMSNSRAKFWMPTAASSTRVSSEQPNRRRRQTRRQQRPRSTRPSAGRQASSSRGRRMSSPTVRRVRVPRRPRPRAPGAARPAAAEPAAPVRALRSAALDEGAVAQLAHRLLQLGLGVHDDGAVPGHRLLDRLTGDEQEANALLAGLDRHLLAAVEEHERAVARALTDEGLVAV